MGWWRQRQRFLSWTNLGAQLAALVGPCPAVLFYVGPGGCADSHISSEISVPGKSYLPNLPESLRQLSGVAVTDKVLWLDIAFVTV